LLQQSYTVDVRKESSQPSQLVKDITESAVIDRAVQVIGDDSEAMRWLGTPIRELGYETPVSLLHTPEGRQSVITVLGRLEHGVL
jgi:putative toxin-antitoxin system antitoxin component (TIGR02293 family)